MKTVLPRAAVCIALLQFVSSGAMSAEKLAGQVALTSMSSGCPAGAMSEAVVAVKMVLPAARASDTPPAPVNRFRYNYRDPVIAARPVITGEIRGFGAPGCTVSFAGEGIGYN